MAGGRLAVLGLSKGSGGPEPRLFLYDTGDRQWHASPVAAVAILSYPQVPLFWTGREVVVTPGPSSREVASVAYDPATDRWRTVDAPILTDVPFGQRSNRLDDGRVIAQIHNATGPLGIYAAERNSWTGSGAPGASSSSPVVVSIGREVIFWGMVSRDGYVRPEEPSTAWIWTPVDREPVLQGTEPAPQDTEPAPQDV